MRKQAQGCVLAMWIAVTAAPAASPATSGWVRDRLSAFGVSLRSLRGPRARPVPVSDDPIGTGDANPLGWPES